MENVYLCLGANLNNPYKTLKKALNLIRKVDGISVKKLKAANNLRSNNIRPGIILVIPN